MLIALWILVPFALLVLTGILYQFLGGRKDRERFTSEGRMITIGRGSEVYLYELGTGEPTVIFEAGFGATHLNWRHIQRAVAQFTGTVAYDRAGLGWSSFNRTPRTPANIAAELRTSLQSAGVKPPYILVGHSFGGLVMRRYALLFPDEVAGVVLVDPMRCEEWPPLNPKRQSEVDLGSRLIAFAVPIASLGVARLGVSAMFGRASKLQGRLVGAAGASGRHVFDRVTTEVRKMPREVWPAVAAHWSRPGFFTGLRSHLEAIPETVREMHPPEPISHIPVTILTPGKAIPLSEDDLRGIGDRTRQLIAANSAHWIHLDEPDLVIDSIREMVGAMAAQR